MNRLTQRYIERHADLIAREDWTTFYKGLDLTLGGPLVADLTRDLLNAGVDPLENMKEVPNAYLTGDLQITSINLHDATSIGRKAFSGCGNLENVSGIGFLETIQNAAFQNCTSLKEIHLPESLQIIDDYAFNHTGLTFIHLPDSIIDIGVECFRNCYKLKEIKFPMNTEMIRPGVCANCPELEFVVIPERAQAVQIGKMAFAGCTNLKDVYLPSTLVSTDLNEAFPMRTATFRINMTERQFREQGNHLALEEGTQVKVTFLK